MQFIQIIESLPQLKRWIKYRKKEGFCSALVYLPPDRKLQLSVEKHCAANRYQTIFIFGQVVDHCVVTQGYILWSESA